MPQNIFCAGGRKERKNVGEVIFQSAVVYADMNQDQSCTGTKKKRNPGHTQTLTSKYLKDLNYSGPGK